MPSQKTPKNSFSERLRLAMAERGLSQQGLAAAAGTTQSTVSGWLNRGSQPRGQGMLKLEEILGVPLIWLQHGIRGEQIEPSAPASDFAKRELLQPRPGGASIQLDETSPLEPSHQRMLLAVIDNLKDVISGKASASSLDESRALLDLVDPPPAKAASSDLVDLYSTRAKPKAGKGT